MFWKKKKTKIIICQLPANYSNRSVKEFGEAILKFYPDKNIITIAGTVKIQSFILK